MRNADRRELLESEDSYINLGSVNRFRIYVASNYGFGKETSELKGVGLVLDGVGWCFDLGSYELSD